MGYYKSSPFSGGGVSDHTLLTNIGVKTHATLDTEVGLNNAKISYTDAAAVALNTAKISYTDAAAVALNTAKISYTDAAAVALNTAKISDINHVTLELPNVDNTSDLSKPISTATQTALDLKQDISSAYSDPLTTNGDIVIRSAGATTRLAKGADGQVLTLALGIPSWSTPVPGVTDHTLLSNIGVKTHATLDTEVGLNNAKISYTDAAAVALNTAKISDINHVTLELPNVDNTSDASKPVSTAQQTALNLKANLAGPTFTGTVSGITAAMVGAPAGSGNSTGTNTGDQTTVSGKSGSTDALNSATTTINVSSATAPTTGQVLTATSSIAATWQTSSAGFSDPMTTRGDVIIRNASNTTARLAIGTNTQVLTSDGTDISWATPAAGGGGLSIETKTANFTAADGKTYLVSSAAARTITLPTAAADIQFWVKDNTGSANTNNFTVARASTEKIENIAANKTLQTNYGSWHFVCDGTNWWII